MKKDKKIIVLIICIVIILVAMISLFIANLNHKEDIDETKITTTTTTEKINKSKTIKEDTFNVSANFDNFEYDNNVKLVVKKVDNVTIENVVSVYDIELVDSNNNKVDVKNTNIQISIPFDNKDNYTNFKVLYLNDKNEILDTIDANYLNGNVVFKTTHLSRYAIVATKEEKKEQEQATTKKTTTKKTTTKSIPTTKQPTTKSTTTKTTTTTKKVTTSTTTTQKVKTYTYKWSVEGDQGGKYYLYVVDVEGNKVSGTVVLTSKATGSSKTFDIPAAGRLFVKDNYIVSNPKGN